MQLLFSLLEDPTFKSQVKYAVKKFNANDKILEQGKEHHVFYMINSGLVRVMISGELDQTKSVHPGIADLEKNDIFGELALFDHSPANADVLSVGESELVEIDIESFQAYLESNPKIGYQIVREILQKLIERLRNADKKIVGLFTWGLKNHQIDQHLD